MEAGFGRIRGKRLQLLPSKQSQFSGEKAKDLSVSPPNSHRRPVKDMVLGSPDEDLGLLVSLLAVPLKRQCSFAAEEPERGQEKHRLPDMGKSRDETCDTPP